MREVTIARTGRDRVNGSTPSNDHHRGMFFSMNNGPRLINKSIKRALEVIELLSNSHGPMKLSQIAQCTKIPESTVLRILNTLSSNHYAHQDPDTKKYALTLKLSYLGNQISGRISIRDTVKPYLVELSKKAGNRPV